MKKICCVVVTYNRKEPILQCLEQIRCQTYKPHTVLIVDNSSKDGTIYSVKNKGFYDCDVEDIH